MKISNIQKKAKSLGIKAGKMSKVDLIRAIQKAEGNFDCFGTATDYCDQLSCAWRDTCVKK